MKVWKYFYLKYIFLFLAFFTASLSIFGIKYGQKEESSESKWVDIIFTLDVSKSMNVADFNDWNNYYTRLDLVKKSIASFVQNHPQDRFWLVIFAWEAVSTVPLTNDHDLFLTFLDWVDYKNLVKQWSDFVDAISKWSLRFTDKDRSKVMIFISDWWDPGDNINSSALETIKNQNKWINYFVVWVWSKDWWKIITWQDVFGRLEYQTYNWQDVISKINIPNLKEIAWALDAPFIQVKNIDDMNSLNGKIDSLNKTVLKKNVYWELADYSRNLAFVSFILFLIFLGLYLLNDKIWKKIF